METEKQPIMMMVTKTYLVITDDVDEAYELTKFKDDKILTLAVGRIAPYNPAQQQQTTTQQPVSVVPPGIAAVTGKK